MNQKQVNMNKVIEIIDSDDDSNTPTSSENTSLINIMEQEDNQQSSSRRRRRKSVLHAMTDPDMQFQTISLEDDDDDEDTINNTKVNPSQKSSFQSHSSDPASSRTLLRTVKVTPKILAPKAPTNDEIVDGNFERFLNDPETINDVYAIAEERARVNYLLAVNGMPEINFTLYTRLERLQFQFEERLKQRKMVNNWDNTRLLENRRSLVQKSDD